MPNQTATDNKIKVVDTVVIDTVNKYLAGGDVISTLVAKLSDQLKTVVEEAVKAALTAVNEEVSRLQTEVTRLTAAVKMLDDKLIERTDDLEQYQRRNNIRIFGVEEKAGEDTDKLVVELCREKLGVRDIAVEALCRSHRVGRPTQPGPDGKKRHRPIIVRFTSYRDRRAVFDSKKRLKGSGITVREDLTARRLEVLRKATELHGARSTWTLDGRVLWVDKDGNRGAATHLADLQPC